VLQITERIERKLQETLERNEDPTFTIKAMVVQTRWPGDDVHSSAGKT
jgi:multidrug efflux pump subunit AcrB